ncbi:MAG: succinate dehydrogenase [Thalassobaculum sp.]|uniref:succinate dehydrogenase n=1 Tax=Thalassobaculum sp. TaxID=2022740 RepID=UPI0032EAF12B
MTPARLFLAQRLTALILAPLVLVHLALILFAVEGGLSAAEILARTRGSVGWAAFYGLFVLVAAIHAPIGLRNVVHEHTGWRGRSLEVAMVALGLLLAGLGARAVIAVVAP